MSLDTSEVGLGTPIQVGVIGTGYFSRFHFEAWNRMPEVNLACVHALDENTGREFQDLYGVDELYSDLETMLQNSKAQLFDVVTPPDTHQPIIELCLKYEKRVICQKPFCPSIEAAVALVSKIEQQKGFVVIHENFRFQPWFQKIRQILDSQTLGDLYEINFDFRPGDGQGKDAYLERQPYFQKQERFFIQETGIHYVDVFRFLMGDITGLFARLSKLNPVIAGEDAGIVTFEFANGARGVLNGNRLADHAADNPRLTMGEMQIDGSRATLRLDGFGRILIREHGCTEFNEHKYDWDDNGFGGDCVYATNRHVVDHLVGGSPIHNKAADYLKNRFIEDAIYRSHDLGKWQTIPS